MFQGILGKLKRGLSKTKEQFTRKIKTLFSIFRTIDEEFLDQLEETLITADVGVETSGKIRGEIQRKYKEGIIKDIDGVLDHLKADLKQRLKETSNRLREASSPPTVILVAGVNGAGKTTSIAKLSKMLRDEGKKVILCASDTFRAAAIEQLKIWSDRVGVDIVSHQIGADPAAVVYDATEAALSRKADILLIDTAGRLQTKVNLMKELEKIRNVVRKKIPDAPHEVLLVLDATTGQNAISQAKHFKEAIDVTGLFLAKLDGTAKGGIVVAIKDQLDIPVKFIGVGETPEDIEPFDADRFVDALFE
ncbi:MAG: signal recognition particle-docking protein FtsY [Planctomycetes bacterium RBG_16_59_8]|nr:MAG: signal recognition particle-docking protein FtsY [Planctomycetes bacterium RBG_16_59_8]